MNVFEFRNRLISDYSSYIRSLIQIGDLRTPQYVDGNLAAGVLWPRPLIQMNSSFEPGETIEDLAREGILHDECRRIFRKDKDRPEYQGQGRLLRLHKHQSEAVRVAHDGHSYVLTTGTCSGKSLAYIIPIVDHILRNGSGRGTQAIVVYPMNTLANSQVGDRFRWNTHSRTAPAASATCASIWPLSRRRRLKKGSGGWGRRKSDWQLAARSWQRWLQRHIDCGAVVIYCVD